MTHFRYIELCNAGPAISKADCERLKSFVPRRTIINRSVYFALRGM